MEQPLPLRNRKGFGTYRLLMRVAPQRSVSAAGAATVRERLLRDEISGPFFPKAPIRYNRSQYD